MSIAHLPLVSGRAKPAQRAVAEGALAEAAATGKLASARDAEAFEAEDKRRRLVTAAEAREEAERKLTEAKRFVRILQAAKLLDALRTVEARIRELDLEIELANREEVEPLRQELGRKAALYAQALAEAQREKETQANAERAKLTGIEAELAKLRADEAQWRRQESEASTELGRLAGLIDLAEQQRGELVADRLLEDDEMVDVALVRHQGQVVVLTQRIETLEAEIAATVAAREQAVAERGTLEGQFSEARSQRAQRQREIDEGQAAHEALQSTRILCRAAKTELADPDSEVLPARLTQLIDHLRQESNVAQMALARLTEARKSIDLTGLAGQDPDVAQVVRVLADAGVKNVRTHAAYVAEVVQDEGRARALVTSDPTRFLGVAVATADQLAQAQKVVADGLKLARPVQVSVATDHEQPTATGTFTLPGDSALFHYGAAKAFADRLAQDEALAERQCAALQQQQEEAVQARHQLDAYVERFGHGKLAALRVTLRSAESRLAELTLQLDLLKGRMASLAVAEREARAQTNAVRHQREDARQACQRVEAFANQFACKVAAWVAERTAASERNAAALAALQALDPKQRELEERRRQCRDREGDLRPDAQAQGIAGAGHGHRPKLRRRGRAARVGAVARQPAQLLRGGKTGVASRRTAGHRTSGGRPQRAAAAAGRGPAALDE